MPIGALLGLLGPVLGALTPLVGRLIGDKIDPKWLPILMGALQVGGAVGGNALGLDVTSLLKLLPTIMDQVSMDAVARLVTENPAWAAGAVGAVNAAIGHGTYVGWSRFKENA